VQLSDLEPHERLALAGLLRFLVRMDGKLSSDEVAALATLGKELGSTLFWQTMARAQQELESADDVVEAVERVERPHVREWIYGILMGIAVVDGLSDEESELLDWLLQTWQMT